MKSEKHNFKTWVEIDLRAIAENVKVLKSKLDPKTKFLAVVKGNGYGHGMLETADTVLKAGADYLAVFDIEEAVTLRKAKIKSPIMVLRSILPLDVETAIKYDLEVAVSTFELLSYLKKTSLKKPLKIHLLVDTGLGRDGFLFEGISKVIKLVKENKNIKVIGLMSHFAGAESRIHDSYTVMQVTFMFEWQKRLNEIGINPITHISATAGTFLSGKFGLDMARFGIGIYGLWPSSETAELSKDKTELKPALAWRTIVNEVKMLQAGSFIGYDLTYRTQKNTIIAVIPVGYSDGYPRSSSNKGSVLVKGKRARILGRVMMNMMVIDVTDISGVRVGDTVTLIGFDKGEIMSAEEVAEASGTINYEITTRLPSSTPRVYKK